MFLQMSKNENLKEYHTTGIQTIIDLHSLVAYSMPNTPYIGIMQKKQIASNKR